MKSLHIKSVKYRIMIAFIVLLFLSLMALSVLYLFQVVDQTKKDYETAIQQQLGIVDKAIYHYISNIASNTDMLANFPIFKEADARITSYANQNSPTGSIPMQPMKNSPYEQDIFQILQSFKNSHPSVKNASLGVEINGGFVKSPPSKRYNGYDARTRDWYKTAVSTPNQVVLSNVYTTSSNELVIYSVKAVLDKHGVIKGVII